MSFFKGNVYSFDKKIFSINFPIFVIYICCFFELWQNIFLYFSMFITDETRYDVRKIHQNYKDYRLKPDVFENRLFRIHVKALRMSGYLLEDNKKSDFFYFWRCALFSLSIGISCALEFAGTIIPIVSQRGIDAISLATSFNFLSVTIAMENAFFLRKKIARLVAFLQEDINQLLVKSDKRENSMFRDTYRYMYRVTVCILVPSLAASSMAYFDALFRLAFNPNSIFNFEQVRNGSDTQILLIQLFPFREVHDDLFVGYILPMYALILAVAATPLWHTFITSLMYYVILKWKIMHKRLSEMDTSKVILEQNESEHYFSLRNDGDRINYLRERMCIFCVKEQLRIRWFVKELQELNSIPVFADFIIFSILICFLFYDMATEDLSNMELLFMSLYLFVMASIIWLYHWHATLIRENSNLMSFAIYSCDWYTYPVHIQKMVHLIMMNTSHPLQMKAGFVSLNIGTFIDIIRASYSYFSILRSSKI